MNLTDTLAILHEVAPLPLAGSWDNVGLLLQGSREVTKVGLTIDLTEAVTDELLGVDCDLIIAYHPPIFSGLKHLTEATPRGRTLLRLIRAGVHVYSPHTALDAARGGMAEWLLEPFEAVAGGLRDVAPIEPDGTDPTLGAGRAATLATPIALGQLLGPLREHLGLSHLRVAAQSDTMPVRTIAVCPGGGGSLFAGLGPVDLLLTGEMRHHDILARFEAGTAVVLTDHTNTERGYLPRLRERVKAALDCDVHIAGADRDPLLVC